MRDADFLPLTSIRRQSMRRRYLQHLVLFLLLVLASCSGDSTPDALGYVFMSGGVGRSAVFEPSTGKIQEIAWPYDWFDPTFLCRGSGDTILLLSDRAPDSVGRYGQFICKWLPPASKLTVVRETSPPGFWCRRLDYSPLRKQYLYSGEYNFRRGVFLLDSNFELIREIVGANAGDKKPIACNAYFVSGDTVVAMIRDSIFYVNTALVERRLLTVGSQLTQFFYSSDRIVGMQVTPPDDTRFFTLTRTRPDVELLEIERDACAAALSPDGSWLIIARDRDFLDWRRLEFVNIIDGRVYHTDIRVGCGPLLWVTEVGFSW